MKLTDKIALITGGTSGLGLATAKRFVSEGAFVFITGRRQTELDAAVKEIGENVIGVRGDISKLADLDNLFSVIKEKKGRLDILFANAGGGAFVPLEEVTEEHFDKYFGINVKGTLFTVQKTLPAHAIRRQHRDQRLDGLDQGRPGVRRLCRDEGGVAFIRPNMGGGLESA
jgi:NAD(P)-dependent dehydrogenase (short-subunit alcohol dehydrogenase family)